MVRKARPGARDGEIPVDRARDVLADPAAARRLLDQAQAKAKRLGKNVPRRVWDQISLLRRMVMAYVRGQYRDFPVRTILLAAAALLYFVNPWDLIPDWIVGFGLLDDASVIAFVINSIQRDVAAFTKWETGRSKPAPKAKKARARRPGSRHRRSPAAA